MNGKICKFSLLRITIRKLKKKNHHDKPKETAGKKRKSFVF